MDGLRRKLRERPFGIDADFADAAARRRFGFGGFTKGVTEGIDPGFVNSESGRRCMSPKSEQMFAARGKCRVQIQAVGRASRADAGPCAELIEGNQHDGPVESLREAAGYQA